MKHLLFIAIIVFFLFSGCTNDAANSPTPDVPPSPTPQTTATATPTEKRVEVFSAKGVYNGRVDMNFIEISLSDGEIKVCRLSDELRESFADLNIKDGANVSFDYTIDNDQFVIQKIK